MTEKEKAIKRVEKGITEPDCPELKADCPYFGRGSEFGACGCEKWYDCKFWRKIFLKRELQKRIIKER